MENVISESGFWISNKDTEHVFIPSLSNEINKYIKKNNIKSVYDFGCGLGDYLKRIVEFDNTVIATGFEGHQTDGFFKNIIKLDLAKDVNLEPVDLVLSIEVGEHIPKKFEQNFINNVVKHAKSHIIISWGIKGQPGLGHVNCQNNDYIINEITKRGWVFDKETTKNMRKLMPDIWIKNTLMVFYVDKNNHKEV